MKTRLAEIAIATLALLFLSACPSDGLICGDGTRLEGSRCVPVCEPGTEIDDETGRCVAVCIDGTYRDTDTGACLPNDAACVSGEVYDLGSEECVGVDELCGEGSTWVAGEAACVSNDRLREADYRESSGENDPEFGGDVEWLSLPGIGEKITFAGDIDAPRDKNGDGWLDPDHDLWVFEVSEPTLLRINADALGGATSGFLAVAIDPQTGWMRFGAANTSRDVTRDIYLPHGGIYGFYMSDALNYFTSAYGPFHGGGDMGYFVEVERLPIPEPTPLTLEEGKNFFSGEWPAEVPEEGSMISFYTVTAEARSMYRFAMNRGQADLQHELLVIGGDALLAADNRGTLHGFVESEELLLVADYMYSFAREVCEHEVMIERLPLTWIDETVTNISIDQPEYTRSQNLLAFEWYGFEAQRNEIVDVYVDSSTGYTCLELYDAYLRLIHPRINCEVSQQQHVPRAKLGVMAPYTGFYGLSSVDWTGAETDMMGTRHIPAHSYDLVAHVSRQIPESVGRVEAETVVTGAVDELTRERYYVLRASAGESFIGEVTGEIAGRTGVYDNLYGAMTLIGEPEYDRLVWRSFEGKSALLGVADAAGGSGSFELSLRPLTMIDLGPVTLDAGFAGLPALPAGSSAEFYRLHLETPGLATVDVNGDLGLAATIRGLDLALVQGPTPLPASFEVAGNEEGIFLEITTMDGSPLPGDAMVGINAALEQPLSHQPSIGRSDSMFIEAPVAISGTLQGPNDVHWVGFEVTDPVRFRAAVLPRGDRGPGNTAMAIYDAFGFEHVANYDGGPGSYSLIDVDIEVEGTFYLGLITLNDEPGDYILEVRTEVLK